MSRTLVRDVCAAALLAACAKPPPAPHRMEIREVTGNTVQFIPAPDQLPYCLIFTESEKGVTRQMTMTQSNQSALCPAGEPVLGLRFRIPADEGRVHVRVLFSDQRLQAATLAEQVVGMANPAFNPMDLRLPGRVLLESIDFVPKEEPPPVVGGVLKAPTSDAGNLTAPR
jgi:hypothetical protein